MFLFSFPPRPPLISPIPCSVSERQGQTGGFIWVMDGFCDPRPAPRTPCLLPAFQPGLNSPHGASWREATRCPERGCRPKQLNLSVLQPIPPGGGMEAARDRPCPPLPSFSPSASPLAKVNRPQLGLCPAGAFIGYSILLTQIAFVWHGASRPLSAPPAQSVEDVFGLSK